jgi:hypothetical protein
VPCVAAPTTTRVAKGLVLQPFGIQAQGKAEDDELITVTRNQVRHWSSEPHMAMQPKAARHRMRQPVATVCKLAPARFGSESGTSASYWQPISPSTVAGGRAVAFPTKIAHVSGNDAGCVACAEKPDDVAETTVSTTPGDVLNVMVVSTEV